MYCTDNDNTGTVEVCRVENDDWLESEITWINQPGLGSVEDSTNMDEHNRWYSWDVTSWVEDQLEVDGVVSVALRTEEDALFKFSSREGSEEPYLEIIYERTGGSVPLGSLAVPGKNENRTRTLKVIIPDDAEDCTWDNITVTATSQADNTVSDNASFLAHATVSRDVEVSISLSPGYDENDIIQEKWIQYAVTVVNKGVRDNYTLEVSDGENWAMMFDDNTLTIPVLETGTATLVVNIPENASVGTEDNITVTATSQTDNTVGDSDSVVARVVSAKYHPKVSISPSEASAAPGDDLTFTVTVRNRGTEWDAYRFKTGGPEDWTLDVSPRGIDWLFGTTLPDWATPYASLIGEEATATLTVGVSDNAEPGTIEELSVGAYSARDAAVSYTGYCTVYVPGASVSIEPRQDNAAPGENATFTVTLTNLSEEFSDNYELIVSDNLGWGPKISPSKLSLAPGGSGRAKLKVRVPDNAINCTRDNIRVIARSLTENRVEGENSCIAHAVAVRGVEVSISPPEREGAPGDNVTFTVTVSNTGDVSDTYTLEVGDGAGWSLSLDNTSLTVPENGNRTTTLTVIIPASASPETEDSITVTATSQADNTVSDSASCTARVTVALGVEVSISPPEREGAPGDTVTFTVTVTNTGAVADNYDLTVSDDAVPSWAPTISDNLLAISAGENETITVGVTVPSDVVKGELTVITVTATSRTDDTVGDSATCTAKAGEKAPTEFPVLPLVVGGVVIGGGIAIAVLLKKRIISLPSLRSRFILPHSHPHR
jgi:uncharacterized membrane protein